MITRSAPVLSFRLKVAAMKGFRCSRQQQVQASGKCKTRCWVSSQIQYHSLPRCHRLLLLVSDPTKIVSVPCAAPAHQIAAFDDLLCSMHSADRLTQNAGAHQPGSVQVGGYHRHLPIIRPCYRHHIHAHLSRHLPSRHRRCHHNASRGALETATLGRSNACRSSDVVVATSARIHRHRRTCPLHHCRMARVPLSLPVLRHIIRSDYLPLARHLYHP